MILLLKVFTFFVNDNNYEEYWYYLDGNVYYNSYKLIDWNNLENGIRDYIPYSNELQNLNTFNDVKNFLETTKLNNKWKRAGNYYWYSPPSDYGIDYTDGLGDQYEFSIYTYIPMILEAFDENNHSILKRIVFASVNIRCCFYNTDNEYYDDESFDKYYIAISLINNTNYWNNENQYIFGNKFLENVNFMRRTMLDYSDELWEELKNGPIASSEIYSDMISSGKYENKSLSSGNYNVSEETLDDYANSLPVFSFKKTDETKKEENNNIVDVITNPKTWNNGFIVLIISMIVVIGSSVFIINKRSIKE